MPCRTGWCSRWSGPADARGSRQRPTRGPIYFTRTTDEGEAWEEARSLFDPGRNSQTIGDHRQAPDAGSLFLGDYIGLVDTDADGDGVSDTFVPFFTQSNSESDPATIYSSLASPQP